MLNLLNDYVATLNSEIESYEQLLATKRQEAQKLAQLQGQAVEALGQLKEVVDELQRVDPDALARGESRLRCWIAGCASGEEAYTLKLLEHFCLAPSELVMPLQILATDVDEYLLSRARYGCYWSGSLKELPQAWVEAAFTVNQHYCLKPTFREGIKFEGQDIRKKMPDGSFHLILCRNLVFTYLFLSRESIRNLLQTCQVGK